MEGMVVNQSFWNGKRIFLTGHTGFKGGWLSIWLQSLGAIVTGFSLEPPTDPNLFTEADVSRNMDSIIGDVRNYDALKTAMGRAQPQIVIHMAAQPLVRVSYARPIETFTTNLLGTIHLMESVRAISSIEAVLIVTSDKCYKDIGSLHANSEDDPLGGADPYSSSKSCAELAVAAYRSSFFEVKDQGLNISIATVRAGNVVGGGDWASDRLVPDAIRAFGKSEALSIRNPHAIRPWQHVLDPLSGYLKLAEALCKNGSEFSGAWNFGPSSSANYRVETIVEKMSDLWGGSPEWVLDTKLNNPETDFLGLNSYKARARLGWRARCDINQALSLTIDWHKAHARKEPMREIMINQIEEFISSEFESDNK